MAGREGRRAQAVPLSFLAPSATIRGEIVFAGQFRVEGTIIGDVRKAFGPEVARLVLALTEPVWVRAYVSEPDLGRVHPGLKVKVTSDSMTGAGYEGQVGFISPVAEFTPKAVETRVARARKTLLDRLGPSE